MRHLDEAAAKADGERIVVDRLWPSGIDAGGAGSHPNEAARVEVLEG
ncbi:MAG: hypothetical protein AB7G48_01585 [Nitrospiraceae bacterium]